MTHDDEDDYVPPVSRQNWFAVWVIQQLREAFGFKHRAAALDPRSRLDLLDGGSLDSQVVPHQADPDGVSEPVAESRATEVGGGQSGPGKPTDEDGRARSTVIATARSSSAHQSRFTGRVDIRNQEHEDKRIDEMTLIE